MCYLELDYYGLVGLASMLGSALAANGLAVQALGTTTVAAAARWLGYFMIKF
jgi:hypothetical protein